MHCRTKNNRLVAKAQWSSQVNKRRLQCTTADLLSFFPLETMTTSHPFPQKQMYSTACKNPNCCFSSHSGSAQKPSHSALCKNYSSFGSYFTILARWHHPAHNLPLTFLFQATNYLMLISIMHVFKVRLNAVKRSTLRLTNNTIILQQETLNIVCCDAIASSKRN